MSFHGGFLGVLMAMAVRPVNKQGLLATHRLHRPLVPRRSGRRARRRRVITAGSPTSLPWAMVFPHVDTPRHLAGSIRPPAKANCCLRCCGGMPRTATAACHLGGLLMGCGGVL